MSPELFPARRPFWLGVDLISASVALMKRKPEYSEEEIDGHSEGELAVAAACYAAVDRIYQKEEDGAEEIRFIDPWPFDEDRDERVGKDPCVIADRIQLLVKAGALVSLEIERLCRLEPERKPPCA